MLCATIRYYWGALPAIAGTADNALASSSQETAVSVRDPRPASRDAAPPSAASPAPAANSRTVPGVVAEDSSVPPIVATVNTQRITREDLARECRRRHGKEVLEAMVNKYLIVEECRRRGISVTRAEVDAEIERLVKPFNIPVEQWLKLLKQERNITPAQYANDCIWPTLALRKLAGERLSISREELVKEFETQYGEAVRARLIAVSSPEKARNLQAQAAAKPEEFRQSGQAVFGRRQRQRQGGDSTDPQTRQLPGDRRRGVQHARRRRFAGHSRRRTIRDPEARRAVAGAERQFRADCSAVAGDSPRPQDAGRGPGRLSPVAGQRQGGKRLERSA